MSVTTDEAVQVTGYVVGPFTQADAKLVGSQSAKIVAGFDCL